MCISVYICVCVCVRQIQFWSFISFALRFCANIFAWWPKLVLHLYFVNANYGKRDSYRRRKEMAIIGDSCD